MAEDLSDALLRRLRKGDDAAWTEFYDALAPDIRAYVGRIGAQSPDDTVGETMVQVVRDLSGFRGSGSDLRAWTFRIARNRVIDEGRRRSRRPVETELSSLNEPAIEGPDEASSGDFATILAGLTIDQRDAVWLRHVVGLSVDETATVMNRAPDAVAALTHRAIRRLRAGLDRH